eukprot:SAG22_NODE_3888_length_1482_cov_1.383225_2_plen_93_part_00
MGDLLDDGELENKANNLRENYVEALEQLDQSRVERREAETTQLLNKITKMVWFQDIGADTNAVLQDIRAALDEEQHSTRTEHDRMFAKLRTR